MINRVAKTSTITILITALVVLVVACSDSDAGLSRADVADVVRSELANVPAPPGPGASVSEVEQIVRDSIADIPEPDRGITSEEVEEIVRDFIGDIPEPAPGVTSDEVERIVQDSIADIPQPSPGLSSEDVERIVQAAIAAIPAPEPSAMMKPEVMAEDKSAYVPPKSTPDEYTQYLVKAAIKRYETDGLDATVAYYNTPESIDGQWYIFIGDENDMMLAHAANPDLVGRPFSYATGPNAYPAGSAVAASADEDGEWFSYTFPNPATGGVETKHSWMVRYDGLLFGTGWYEDGPQKSDPPAYTQAFVRQAIKLYDAVGLEDTVAYYNTPDSIDGQWYIFIGDENDTLIAHAANPSLVGVPAVDVKGPNAYPSGSAVAAVADQDGEWFSYTFPNPATGGVDTKHSWMVKYDGLTFGSGWYEDGPQKSDSPAYTQAFVRQAIKLYDAVGLEDTVAYYNTPDSIDGQWYIFIGDEEDMMLAHAANPDLVGRPFSYATGPNAYPAGSAVAASGDQDGEWFSYTYPNPSTGAVETKHSWMVRYDGLLFGSGWYEDGPAKSDAPAYTKAFVQQAINLYNAVGLDETITYYSNPESVDGQWYAFIVDEDGYTIAHHNEMFIGRDPALRVDSTGYFYGDELLGATESGRWVSYVLLNPETGDERRKHTWAVRHDSLLFGSGWYEE